MYLANLRIENFRGVRQADLIFGRRTLLLGPNNVGKTTVLEAAALLLGRDRMVVNPSEWDFYNGWVFDADVPLAHAEEDCVDGAPQSTIEAPTPLPKSETEAGLPPASNPIAIHISGVLADLTREEQRLFGHPALGGAMAAWDSISGKFHNDSAPAGSVPAVRISFIAYFDAEHGEVVSHRYFPIPGEDPTVSNPTARLTRRQIQAAGYYLLSATRLWKDAVRFTSSIFGSLLRQREVRTGAQMRKIARALGGLQPKAHDAEELLDLLAGLKATVGRFIPLAEDDPLGFEVTDLSSPDVERALTLFLRGSHDDLQIPMARHGSAAISVQILAMLVMLGTHRRQNSQSFLLGLEEPELHLHPHAQRNLITAVREEATQLLATTHSPAITECFEPTEICVLSSANGVLTGQYLLSHEMKQPTKNVIKRWAFNRRRQFAEALMAPAVLLVEGITEADLLPSLSRIQAAGNSLDSMGCTVIECNGSELPKMLPLLERFPGVIGVLVDGDADGDNYAEVLRQMPAKLRPQLLLQLPENEAFELSLAHGLTDQQAESIGKRLKPMCEELLVAEPTVVTVKDLAKFFVATKMKGNAPLRAAIASCFDEEKLAPPIVAQLRTHMAQAVAGPTDEMNEVRIS